jgi:putative holliday junction resolvase
VSGRILGFDYGIKRIGIAVGNQKTNSSQCLSSVSAKNGEPFWEQIDALIQEWKPATLIVGLPLKMDGTHGDAANAATRFADALGTRYNIPVTLVDERLSSNEADVLIRQSAPSGRSLTRKRQKVRDSVAAELIIKTYLNDNPAPI